MNISASYSGCKGRITARFDRNVRLIPVNASGRDPGVIKAQLSTEKKLYVGLKIGFFDPIHPMHIALVTETISRGFNDRVLILPNGDSIRKPQATRFDRRLADIERTVSLFSPFLAVSALKSWRRNCELVELIKSYNADNIIFNWISSDTGTSSGRILEKLKAGYPLDKAVDETVSPHVFRYLYGYYEENAFVDTIQKIGGERVVLIKFPLQYMPLRNLHSSQIRERKVACFFKPVPDGVDMSIEQRTT
jgi:hypothetical protein